MIVGNFAALLKIVANLKIALRVRSPVFKVNEVDEGGAVRSVMISIADWRKKSSSDTSGNFIVFGKNVTVSTCRSALVLGK